MLKTEAKEVVNSMYEAAISGDIEAFNAAVDENAIFHEPPSLPYGGSYRGRAAMNDLFLKVNEYFDFSSMKVDYIIAEGERVVTSLRLNTRQGIEMKTLEAAVVRNGKVVELHIFLSDPSQVKLE